MISSREITVYMYLNVIWQWLYSIPAHDAFQMCVAPLTSILYSLHSFKRRQGDRKRKEKEKKL